MAIVDPKLMISHFFLGRDSSGDCGIKIQNGRFPTFFPDATSMAIVDPKLTISLFLGRDISGDCGSKIQNGRIPIFFPDATSMAIVDPK